MATVDLLNSGWLTNADDINKIQVTTEYGHVKFYIQSRSTVGEFSGSAKATIEIDVSKYKSISLDYSKITNVGTTGLTFGIFDNKVPGNASSGTTVYSNAGEDGGDFDRVNGGILNIEIPSSLSGYKYVGFGFYGQNYNSSASEHVYINSLTAVERGYTLTYNANGGSGAPSSVSEITSATISSTIPTRDGYDFMGWCTSQSAAFVNYVAGDTITLTSNTTLYAVWRKLCTITYDANGGTGTTSPQTVAANSIVTLRSNGFTAPTSQVWTLTLDGNGGNNGTPTFKGNYFNKWREGSTSGDPYSAGDSYAPSNDITMYAWWGTKYIWGTTTRDPDYSEGYTVTLDANGGICDADFLTSEIITTYDFSGWGNRESDPTYTFESDTVYTQTSNYTAYAIWSPTETNGSITLPTPTRGGYKFLGWSTDPYDIDSIIGECTPIEDMVLYAIWEPTGLVYIYDGEFSPYQVWIYDDSGWSQYIPYIYTESGWEMYSG